MPLVAVQRAAVALVVATGLLLPLVAGAVPSKPEARKKFERGGEMYANERYGEAAALLEASWNIEKDLATLFAWAQAERLSGDCKEAVRLYNQFLDAGPPDSAVSPAKDGIVACAGALAEDNEQNEDDEVFLPIDESDAVRPPETEEPEPDSESQPDERRDSPPAWYRDPVGGSLVAVGTVGVGVGTGLLVSAQVQENAGSENYREHDEKVGRIRNFRIAGGVTLGVGGALLVAGIVRWAILGTRARDRSMAGVSFDGQSAMVTWRGRF